MTANTVLQATEDKWKPILDQVDIPERHDDLPRKTTAILLIQDVPDPAYVAEQLAREVIGVEPLRCSAELMAKLEENYPGGVSPMMAPNASIFELRAKYGPSAYQANTTVHETKLEAVDQMYEYFTEEDLERAKKRAEDLINNVKWE